MYNLIRADLNYAYRKHMLDKAQTERNKTHSPENREISNKTRKAHGRH